MKVTANIVGYMTIFGRSIALTNYAEGNSTNSEIRANIESIPTLFGKKIDIEEFRVMEAPNYILTFGFEVSTVGALLTDYSKVTLHIENFGENTNDMDQLLLYISLFPRFLHDGTPAEENINRAETNDTIIIHSVSPDFKAENFRIDGLIKALRTNRRITEMAFSSKFNLSQEHSEAILNILDRNKAINEKLLPWYMKPFASLSTLKFGLSYVGARFAFGNIFNISDEEFPAVPALIGLGTLGVLESIIKHTRTDPSVVTKSPDDYIRSDAFMAGKSAAKSWCPGWLTTVLDPRKLASTTRNYPGYLQGMLCEYTEQETTKRTKVKNN